MSSHHGNIGASARAMLTMGLTRLVLVAPLRFPDPDAVARASGATSVLDAARVVATLDEAIAGCALAIGLSSRPREFAGRVLPVRAAAAAAVAHAAHGDVALVFGSEMSGLSNHELSRCAMIATIPTNPDYASLNLAAAVQVACYELALASAGFAVAERPRRARGTGADLEALHARLTRLLVANGFLDPREPGRLDERMRRLAARLDLEAEEVALLHGMLDSFSRRERKQSD